MPILKGMTQAQREVTNHIEFQVSLLKLLAVPESFGKVQVGTAAPKTEQLQMEELVAHVTHRQ